MRRCGQDVLTALDRLGASDPAAFDAVLRRIRSLPAVRVSEANLLLATIRSNRV